MLKFRLGLAHPFSTLLNRVRRSGKYLILPLALFALITTLAFRQSAIVSLPDGTLGNPLQLPIGWSMPPVPADNPITQEKFVLGRYLFYEYGLSGDNRTSCASCHNQAIAFGAQGPHAGAFGVTGRPIRMVPRLMNLAYDSVFTWDGHIHSLEEQVHIAVLKKGDFQADTAVIYKTLSSYPAYRVLFKQAFGDEAITLDRIAKAIATFERCLITGNSPYDQYMSGDSSALTPAAQRGMQLFYDTTKTNCAFCHNNRGLANPNGPGQTFTDNNYYRTGTFEPQDPRSGGYGFNPGDSTGDTTRNIDPGRAGVTKDSMDIGKFRTPSLRNVQFTPPFGASGTVANLRLLISTYNDGGDSTVLNKDEHIKALNLVTSQISDIESFLNSLTDGSYTSNLAFSDPGAPKARVDDRIVSGHLTVYPNPSPGFVTITWPTLTGPIAATLVSQRGEIVWRRTLVGDGKFRLDFSGVANGSYHLELRSGDTRQSASITLNR